MRLGHVRQSRPDWYDRNPISIGRAYEASAIAPHGSTLRWTYTVPTGKKFIIEGATSNVLRDAAAVTASFTAAFIRLTGLTGGNPLLAYAQIFSISAGVQHDVIVGATISLQAAEVADGRTSDGSTGGTIAYALCMKGTEFDA